MRPGAHTFEAVCELLILHLVLGSTREYISRLILLEKRLVFPRPFVTTFLSVYRRITARAQLRFVRARAKINTVICHTFHGFVEKYMVINLSKKKNYPKK